MTIGLFYKIQVSLRGERTKQTLKLPQNRGLYFEFETLILAYYIDGNGADCFVVPPRNDTNSQQNSQAIKVVKYLYVKVFSYATIILCFFVFTT